MTPLTLVQFTADLPRLMRWLSATGQPQLREDLGYALHACARATLGSWAPKPFVLHETPDASLLIGYVRGIAQHVEHAARLSAAEPLAAQALGLSTLRCRTLPNDWTSGEELRFTVRVAPVVRSRSQPGGGYHEVDAALHASRTHPAQEREAIYSDWLSRELQRGQGAELLSCELRAFMLRRAVRRQARTVEGGLRHSRSAWIPDATLQGRLRIGDPDGFDALLGRGVGRHRAFGFGCLLLAPG
jgi:CRISPR system Cascade subunit CasE